MTELCILELAHNLVTIKVAEPRILLATHKLVTLEVAELPILEFSHICL